MRLPRACLDCGKITTDTPTRCHACHAKSRKHYTGEYRKTARQITKNANTCWICGQGANPQDPWTADHLNPGDPASPLAAAHRSCNSRRGNTPHHLT